MHRQTWVVLGKLPQQGCESMLANTRVTTAGAFGGLQWVGQVPHEWDLLYFLLLSSSCRLPALRSRSQQNISMNALS